MQFQVLGPMQLHLEAPTNKAMGTKSQCFSIWNTTPGVPLLNTGIWCGNMEQAATHTSACSSGTRAAGGQRSSLRSTPHPGHQAPATKGSEWS